METEYAFAKTQNPAHVDPTAALSQLHYHLAATGILNLLREAWDKASDDAKRVLADRIVTWAGQNIQQLNVGDLVRHVLGRVVADGRLVLTPEQEAALVQALYAHMMGALNSKSSYDVSKVRDAIVEASKQRLAELSAEVAVTALAGPGPA